MLFERALGESEFHGVPGLKILTWNTLAYQCCDDSEQGFPFTTKEDRDPERRILLQIAELSSCGADLMVLQEVDRVDVFSSVLSHLGYQHVSSKSPKHCVVVFFRSAALTLLNYSDIGERILHAEFLHNSTRERITLAAVHLKAKRGFETVRVAQVEKILDAGKYDFVIGDFNDTPDSPALKLMLAKGFLHAVPSEPFTTIKTRRNSAGKKERQERIIDYICFNHRFAVGSVLESDNSFNEDREDLLSKEYPSDHLSQMAEIVFWREYVE